MTKTDSPFVSPICAVMEKAISGVSPAYDSLENTTGLLSGCARPTCWVIGHARTSTVMIRPARRARPFKAQIE